MLCVSTQIAQSDDLASFEAMLRSVSFAGELIIFNMERTDPEAHALFAKYKARIISVKTPQVVEAIRDRQIKEATGDWVLIMDFDEVIPVDLQNEILAIISNSASCPAYAIPRINYSLGYPLTRGGWERDSVIRLVRRRDFVSWPSNIHSAPVMRGLTIKTIHAMEHHKDTSLTQMVDKTNRYSQIEAGQFYQGRLASVTPLTLLRKWWMETLRRGIFKRGFLDGKIGLIQSLYQGYSVFITYAKLYELQSPLTTSRVISKKNHGIPND